MSLAKLVFPSLNWVELWSIISYLSIKELYRLGCTCKTAFLTFLREKTLRSGLYRPGLPYRARFLSKLSTHEKVLLVSYPRSGNSFLRKLLELRTGIITGSDSRPNRTLAASLLKFGYIGEGITDQSVWVVKSHFPERMGYIRCPVRRVILLVRNPFDAIESYFHMAMTNTHDKMLSEETCQQLSEIWNQFVTNEAHVWVRFNQFWLDKTASLPILLIRYEDLLENEDREMHKITRFLIDGQKPYCVVHVEETEESSNSSFVPGYIPKSKTIGKSLRALTVQEANTIATVTYSQLQLFGYQFQPLKTEEQLDDDHVFSLPAVDKAVNHFTVTSSAAEIIPNGQSECAGELASSMSSNCFEQSQQQKAVNSCCGNTTTIIINDKFSIRADSDKFGRNITDLRRALTNNDLKPFATR